MAENPLVSIIIPVYNGASYLAEAIESALAQTYPCFEVIVVDDGSTDAGATRQVAQQFGERIRYILKSNGGVATALNAGIEAMCGDLFSWLSHDDLYKPEKIARQVEALQRFGAPCIVIGDFETISEKGEPLHHVSLAGKDLIARPLDAIFHGLINGCALLVPRDLFDRAGNFEPGLPSTQDYYLWYRMARLAPFVHCPHSDVQQRVHSLQGSSTAAHLAEASRMFAHLLDQTPAELMQAYDGSPLRFLLRVREPLGAYPGLLAYLQFRIQQLLRSLPYSIVLCSDGQHDVLSAVERLQSSSCPPAEIVTLDLSTLPVTEMLLAAERTTSTDIFVFLRAERLPSEPQRRAALETLIQTNADIARPSGAPATASILDGLLVRRNALPLLREFLANGTLDDRIVTYPLLEPFLVATEEEILKALTGQIRIDYHHGLSESAIAHLLLSKIRPELPTILFLTHSLGGETNTHLTALLRAVSGKANCLIGLGQAAGSLHLTCESIHARAGLVFHIPRQLADLVRLLQTVGVRRADVHHACGFEPETEALLSALHIPFDLTLSGCHDSPLAPKASRVIAISRDLAARVDRLHPGLPVIAAFHWDEFSVRRVRHVLAPGLWDDEPLRVLLVANSSEQAVLCDVARLANQRNLPLEFHVMGPIDVSPSQQTEAGDRLILHGSFEAERFHELLCGLAPHVGWLPSQLPETWSYVLSDFFEAALPVAATNIGSSRERCYGRPFTWLLPWNSSAESWLNFFLRLRKTKLTEPPRWDPIEDLPPARLFYFDEYLSPASVRSC